MTPAIEVAVRARATVGEGPCVDGRHLLWVDIPAGRIHDTDLDTGASSTTTVPTMVGAAVPGPEGLVAATTEGFAAVIDGELHTRRTVLPAGERMNDAKCDPHGRLWAGSTEMRFADGAGRLWLLDTEWTPHSVLDDLALPNGLGWSPDGQTMYLIDSVRRELHAFDAPGPDDRMLRRRRLLHTFDDDGLPDGLAVDTHGCLWVAVWGSSRLVRISPWGQELCRIPLPVVQPSSCAFGGPDRDVLYVTSAADGVEGDSVDGSVLAVRGLGVRGVAVSQFGR